MLDEALNHAARAFGIEMQSAVCVGGGFSAASVFCVTSTDGNAFAIRRTPKAAALATSRLTSFHRLLQHVHSEGVTVVPVPLRIDAAAVMNEPWSLSIESAESWIRLGANYWQAEPWMPGKPLQRLPTELQIRSGLKCLNSFHEAARGWVNKFGRNEWFHVGASVSPGVLRRLAIIKELQAGFLAELRSKLAGDADQRFRNLAVRICTIIEYWLSELVNWLTPLSKQSFFLQPVIRDIWRSHVLYTGDNVTGLIDLSAAASDHVCFDISRLFRSWFQSDTVGIRKAVEIFADLHPLDQSERKLLQVLDATTVLLSPVTWLRRRFESREKGQCSPEILSRLTELTQIAAEYEPL